MNIVTKTYESLLPFLVVEAISAQGAAFSSMSVRMIDEGWAWLVSGRKLLIWKFKESKKSHIPKARRMLNPCFELQLPQSDLCHKADLIHTFFIPQNPNTSIRATTVPAALVISPEGVIRFWSNIANERFTESSIVDMQGQEFCTLVPLSSLEYFVGTTTGSVIIVHIDTTAHDPKNILVCSPLTTPSGLLSGFGRRVTNLFFGPMASDVGTDTRRPLIAVPKYSQATINKTGSTQRPYFVMSSSFKLKHWSRTNEGVRSINHLIREWDLQKNIYMLLLSGLGLSESDSLNFWPIDMVTTRSIELLILIVTLDSVRDNTINYAICLFNPYQANEDIKKLTMLQSHSWSYSNESEDQLLALRFLERRATSSILFMYDRKFLFLTKIDEDILDAIDYNNQDDGILGAGIVEEHPILFTQRDGLIYVVPVANNNKSRLNETSLQIEPQLSTSLNSTDFHQGKQESMLHSTSTKVDPMIVELDEDVENVDNHSNHSKVDRDVSLINSSVNQSNMNKSMNQSRQKADEVREYLKENKEFEWIQQIDAKQYGLASETLAKLAEQSETLKERKETLLALSKLSKLAE